MSKNILSESQNPLLVGLYTFPGMITIIKNICRIMSSVPEVLRLDIHMRHYLINYVLISQKEKFGGRLTKPLC